MWTGTVVVVIVRLKNAALIPKLQVNMGTVIKISLIQVLITATHHYM